MMNLSTAPLPHARCSEAKAVEDLHDAFEQPSIVSASAAARPPPWPGPRDPASLSAGQVPAGGHHMPAPLHYLVNGPGHVERLFRDVVVLTLEHLSEPANGLLQRDVGTGPAREHFRHEERLGGEPVHLAGARHGQLGFPGKLITAQN